MKRVAAGFLSAYQSQMGVLFQVRNLPQTLRNRYLESLSEPQEWFLEELVRTGEIWELPGEGYAVFNKGNLLEFYTMDASAAPLHLSNLIRERPVRKVFCKSFDVLLFDAIKDLGWPFVETAFLFRKRNRVALKQIEDFYFRRAETADLAEAWSIGQDFFDSSDEVERIFRSNGLWVSFSGSQMVGSGTMIPIDNSGRVVDVGMVTRQSQRNKGFASLVVAELARILESEGKRPICGCAQSNLASKAALEKAGFVSEHRLVQIDIPY